MSEPIIIAIIAGIMPTIGIVVQLLLSSVRDRLSMAKIQEIHLIVNSQRAVMVTEIDDLKSEVRHLREILNKDASR